jgi:FAD synthase
VAAESQSLGGVHRGPELVRTESRAEDRETTLSGGVVEGESRGRVLGLCDAGGEQPREAWDEA